jgi:hypothetical protein
MLILGLFKPSETAAEKSNRTTHDCLQQIKKIGNGSAVLPVELVQLMHSPPAGSCAKLENDALARLIRGYSSDDLQIWVRVENFQLSTSLPQYFQKTEMEPYKLHQLSCLNLINASMLPESQSLEDRLIARDSVRMPILLDIHSYCLILCVTLS